jgi:hypothetical protein
MFEIVEPWLILKFDILISNFDVLRASVLRNDEILDWLPTSYETASSSRSIYEFDDDKYSFVRSSLYFFFIDSIAGSFI